MFLDGRLDLEHEKDYSVVLKNNCALVTFTKKYSVDGMSMTVYSIYFVNVIVVILQI